MIFILHGCGFTVRNFMHVDFVENFDSRAPFRGNKIMGDSLWFLLGSVIVLKELCHLETSINKMSIGCWSIYSRSGGSHHFYS